jgi:hypothetical protein
LAVNNEPQAKEKFFACGLSWKNHLNPVRQGWGTSPACLGIAIAPETLYAYYNLLILKAIAILPILS